MRNKRRFVAALLIIAVCFAMLTSVFCLAAEADHQCTGEYCPVCCQLAVVRKAIQALLCLTATAGLAFRFAGFTASASAKEAFRRLLTPVALRVKISD